MAELNYNFVLKKETKLLKKIKKAFEAATGMQIEWQDFQKGNDTWVDTVAHIKLPEGEIKTFYVIMKAVITQAAIGRIVEQFRHYTYDRPMALVTPYVTPQQAEQLRQLNVPFIDAAGNAHINDPPLFIYVAGKKQPPEDKGAKNVRVFRPTGLQVVFALLCNPELVDAPYRDIAHAAQVALGTVGWAMHDLKRLDYLLDKGAYGRKIINRKKLFTVWVEAYARDLRPKMYVGRFAMAEPEPLEKINWEDLGIYLGGEAAAAKITEYLKPAQATVYATKNRDDFVQNLIIKKRLKKDPNGNIEFFWTFWNFEYPWQFKEIAPPLLVYADLMATANDRNIETAKMIYDEFLARRIEQD